MKNLAHIYITKTSSHLFTRDGKVFLKVLPVGDLILKIEFGEEISVKILPHSSLYQVKSSAGKIYLSQELKWIFFPQWGDRYRAVKSPKRWKLFYERIKSVIDPEIDYTDGLMKKEAREKIEEVVLEFMRNSFRIS